MIERASFPKPSSLQASKPSSLSFPKPSSLQAFKPVVPQASKPAVPPFLQPTACRSAVPPFRRSSGLQPPAYSLPFRRTATPIARAYTSLTRWTMRRSENSLTASARPLAPIVARR